MGFMNSALKLVIPSGTIGAEERATFNDLYSGVFENVSLETQRFPISDVVYTLVATENNAVIQNTSSGKVRVVFAESAPPENELNFSVLPKSKFIQKVGGLPVGNVYVRMSDRGMTGFISVSE